MKLLIKFVYIILITSCSHLKKHQDDYAVLEKQQILLHKKLTPDFKQTQKDYTSFKKQLQNILPQYFSSHEIKKIKEAVNNKNAVRAIPVFHSFHGAWSGKWREENKEDQFYKHCWSKPYVKEGVTLQRVFIFPEKQMDAPIAAINSASKNKIYGGVDRIDDRTHAAHLGFYVDEKTLIWIARFSEGDYPYYSFYYEQITTNPTEYKIKGFGFTWDKTRKKILRPHQKSGIYTPVQEQFNWTKCD